MKIILTKDADTDIDDIFSYSLSTFGTAQTQRYYLGLKEKINEIANGFIASTSAT